MKDKLHTPLAILLVLAAHQSCSAQTLSGLYQKARERDNQFLAAQSALTAALEKRPQALAGLRPSVNLTANNGRQSGQTSFDSAPFIDRNVQSWGWTLQLTQPLIRWSNWIAVDLADTQIQQAQAQFALAHNELVLRTSQAYLDVVVAMQGIGVAQSQLDAFNEQLASAQRGFQLGTGTVTDVHEVQAKQALATSQKVAAFNDLQVKEAELTRIVGETSVVAPVEIGEQSLPNDARALTDWLELSEIDNVNVRLQQALLIEAQQLVRKNGAQHAPTLDWVASQSTNFASGTMTSPADVANRVQSQQISLQFNLPLYAGGATSSAVREAIALEEKTRQDLLAAKRNAASQVRQAYAGVLNGLAQVEALKMAVFASQNAVASNRLGFKIGTRTNTDVLVAEQQLYQTQRDLNKARIDTAMQRLKLRASAGQLQVADVQDLQTLITPAPVAAP
ncbi:MAG: TolC family outer membrane protein [Rhodoferax sp.]